MKIIHLFVLMVILTACNESNLKTDPSVTVTPQTPPCTSCRMFVTTNTYTGNLGGVSGADTFCRIDPNKPATGTYKALIMDSTVRSQVIDWVLKPNTTYYRKDGTTLMGTTGPEAVFNLGSMGFDALEDPMDSKNYYSGMTWGSNTQWTAETNPGVTCQGWTSSDNSYWGNSGLTGDPSDFFISENTIRCNNALPLICVEQ